jgi:hypothetical protein
LQDTRWRDLQLHTVVGVVRLRVRHGYAPALARWVCPAREAWGLAAYQRLSPELEARLTYTATEGRVAQLSNIFNILNKIH